MRGQLIDDFVIDILYDIDAWELLRAIIRHADRNGWGFCKALRHALDVNKEDTDG